MNFKISKIKIIKKKIAYNLIVQMNNIHCVMNLEMLYLHSEMFISPCFLYFRL